MAAIAKYEALSGQLVNIDKSSFIVAKFIPLLVIQRIKNVTGFMLKHLPVIYLCAPLYTGNKKASLFDSLLQSLNTCINGWKKSVLSFGGRLQLIKSVLAMPIYLMQVVTPPKSIIIKVERMFNRFFWGSCSKAKKMHWTKWDCISFLTSEGGLGVRKLSDVTSASSYKLWWHFCADNSLLSSFLKSKYCRTPCPSQVVKWNSDSSPWRRMCAVRHTAEICIFWALGEGKVCFWHDCWLADKHLEALVDGQYQTHEIVHYYWSEDHWDMDKLFRTLPIHLLHQVASNPFDRGKPDKACWRPNASGEFFLKSAWEQVRAKSVGQQLLKEIWSLLFTPTMFVFYWRLLHDLIPTDERLQKKGIIMESKCTCCNHVETTSHLFLHNDEVQKVWRYFAGLFRIDLPTTSSIRVMVQNWRLSPSSSVHGHMRTLIPLLILWFTWTTRNDVKHRSKKFKPDVIIWKTIHHIQILYHTKLFKREHWKGDRNLADLLEYSFHMPQATLPFLGVSFMMRLVRYGLHSMNFLGEQTNVYAELFAVYRGLDIAIEMGISTLWIETDASAIISIINSTTRGHWKHQHLLMKIHGLLGKIEYKLTHIYREGNGVADYLANEACRLQQHQFISSNQQIAGKLKGLIRMDALQLPNFKF
ncbi:UNVERIFIED_CONTAM: hypothetical protein Slati_2789400 [Sesamum latifolium]|uniref:RNase H type-1 domain-containing protein n=1 Tax=Sesamum latifolium TaxID=2727402 RepID=A0AAW2W1E6_9LAMI